MSTRPNLVLAIVTAGVVLLAVVAGLLSATRDAPKPDPATADGVAQLFVLAAIEGDDDVASGYLAPSVGCTPPFLERSRPEAISMYVASSSVTGDRATVQIDITEMDGGMYGSYTHRESFHLERDGGSWLLTEIPWPVYYCE